MNNPNRPGSVLSQENFLHPAEPLKVQKKNDTIAEDALGAWNRSKIAPELEQTLAFIRERLACTNKEQVSFLTLGVSDEVVKEVIIALRGEPDWRLTGYLPIKDSSIMWEFVHRNKLKRDYDAEKARLEEQKLREIRLETKKLEEKFDLAPIYCGCCRALVTATQGKPSSVIRGPDVGFIPTSSERRVTGVAYTCIGLDFQEVGGERELPRDWDVTEYRRRRALQAAAELKAKTVPSPKVAQ